MRLLIGKAVRRNGYGLALLDEEGQQTISLVGNWSYDCWHTVILHSRRPTA
ncbi:hypothetical protein [Mycobacterium colombiense]|uniref:hypothetical protein n=1 Tax=Mycobacterium colombiense TaxID=339268 RepID=UPI001E6054BD|nr:hypothetical protein [Mycobacterium colombiense]